MIMYNDTGLTSILSDGVDAIVLDTDQNAEFGGNISGSATSTGSFGSLIVAGNVQRNLNVDGNNDTTDLITAQQNNANAFIIADASGDQYIGGFRAINNLDDDLSIFSHGDNRSTTRYGINMSGFGEIFAQNMTNGLVIGVGTAHRPIIFGSNGREVLRIQGGPPDGPEIISGSAVSTGSFGRTITKTMSVDDVFFDGGDNPNSVNPKARFFYKEGQYDTIFGDIYHAASLGGLTFEDNYNHSTSGFNFILQNGTSALRIKGNGDGDITIGGDISGSATSTGSFGHFIGDGSGLTKVFEGTAASASISTRLTSFTDGTATLVSGSATSTGSTFAAPSLSSST